MQILIMVPAADMNLFAGMRSFVHIQGIPFAGMRFPCAGMERCYKNLHCCVFLSLSLGVAADGTNVVEAFTDLVTRICPACHKHVGSGGNNIELV